MITDKRPGFSQAQNKKERVEGVVFEVLPDTNFRVELEDGRKILTYLCGKMRIRRIRVVTGDRVLVEISSYDDKRGRIIYRNR